MRVQASKPVRVRVSDAITRDQRKVQLGGVIKSLPVKEPGAATRDRGKVRLGGVVTYLPSK